MKNTGLKTLAMKARVYNYIRKTLYKKRWEDIKTGERDQILMQIFEMNKEAHWELLAYKMKRKEKARINKLRQERGWKSKKKTPLAVYNQQNQR